VLTYIKIVRGKSELLSPGWLAGHCARAGIGAGARVEA